MLFVRSLEEIRLAGCCARHLEKMVAPIRGGALVLAQRAIQLLERSKSETIETETIHYSSGETIAVALLNAWPQLLFRERSLTNGIFCGANHAVLTSQSSSSL